MSVYNESLRLGKDSNGHILMQKKALKTQLKVIENEPMKKGLLDIRERQYYRHILLSKLDDYYLGVW
jgi:hypothetical protein